jgi:cell division protein FtsL
MTKEAKQEKMQNLKMSLVWMVLLTIFMGQLLVYTWCRVQCVRIGYEISNETGKYQDLMMMQNNLKIELTRLKSPERIAKIAKNRLGLMPPTPEQMIVVK